VSAAGGDQPHDGVLQVRRDGHVLIVTLDRPRQRNALNAELRAALRAAFDAFEADGELRCAVLTGNGPAFCAGGDLKEMAGQQVQIPLAEWSLLLGSTGQMSKPVIAAVNGYALAGGFRLAQLCDLAVAAEGATFGISEAKRGRGAPWAAPLIDMVPKRVMMELLLTGEPMTARRAYDLGFVNRVVPLDDLMAEAVRMAHLVASNAPLSVRAAKQLVELSTELGRSEAERAADELYEPVYVSEDALEGPRAFAEGRDPIWTGR
jgi:enoyl-CoA hydratase/carnithine racemase